MYAAPAMEQAAESFSGDGCCSERPADGGGLHRRQGTKAGVGAAIMVLQGERAKVPTPLHMPESESYCV